MSFDTMDENAFIRDVIKCLNKQNGPDIREATENLMNDYSIRDFGIKNLYKILEDNQGALGLFGVKMNVEKPNPITIRKIFLIKKSSRLKFEDLYLSSDKKIITVSGFLV